MRFIRLSINVLLLTFLLVACTNMQLQPQVFQTVNPTVEEVISEHNDIFLWNDLVYVTDIEWLNELVLTENELLGTITAVSNDADEFTNGTANKLNVGAEIYSANERRDVLIVKEENVTKYYLKLVEG